MVNNYASSPSSLAAKPYRRKLRLSITTAVVFTIVFITLIYTQRLRHVSSAASILGIKPTCSKQTYDATAILDEGERDGSGHITDPGPANDEKFEFDPDECSVTTGKWVFNRSIKPLYSDRTCPYLDKQFSCVKNGRPDSDYRHWEWQPDDCYMPRFNAKIALKRLRGKRLMFVGDSLQRGQWESFICMVESVIPPKQKSMRRGRIHSVFRAKEYNASIEFYWAPFLIESNTDVHIIADPKKRIMKVDSVEKHAKNWTGIDILVFNTYVWWMTGLRINSLWGSFGNGEEGYEELDLPIAYRLGLKTWANWIDSNIDPNKTRVFFTTMSPTHLRSQDWNNKEGVRCFNETKPVMKKGHWGTGSDKRVMQVVSSIIGRMKVPVKVLNITQLSEYRIDGHSSVYTETGGKLLTEEEKANPHNADCIHWCLPGVPDTWNQIFYAHL